MIKETPIIGASTEKEIFTPVSQTRAMATSVGLPDDKDVENINRCIKQYETARPGELKIFIKQAKREQAMLDNDLGQNHEKYRSAGKPSFRRALTMPIGLYRMIDEAYPLMFNNPEHLHWFMRKFQQFNIARRI